MSSGAALRRRLVLIGCAANLVGGLIAFLLGSSLFGAGGLHLDVVSAVPVVYAAIVAPIAFRHWRHRSARLWRWLDSERAACAPERELVLRAPVRFAALAAVVWAGAGVTMAAAEAPQSVHESVHILMAAVLGALTSCALTYLLAERALRPAVRRALSVRTPEASVTPGVAARTLMAWGLATGVPLLGLVALSFSALAGEFDSVDRVAGGALALAAVAFVAGLLAMWLVTSSLSESLRSMRRAAERVRAGDLQARVTVDDGSEVGLLQAGFNEMTAGLEDRERLRDLFGRHVGEEVARAAADGGAELGGDLREAAALFVDLVGSTTLAATRPPEEVVELLNRFFTVVVEEAEVHGGWVNKFEGDAALCVFGVPAERADWAGGALAAARAIADRLSHDVPDAVAAVGVSAGSVVAGNVGAERRLEYTVIGDPVNEAARLCELAKSWSGRVLASGSILERAGPDEAAQWRLEQDPVQLRGRVETTRIAVPVGTLES